MQPHAGFRAGFRDPVRQSQAVFRTVMNAMARPGIALPLPVDIDPPAPLSAPSAGLLLALADFETSIWLDDKLQKSPGVAQFLSFHCGARLTRLASEANFAAISTPRALPPLAQFAQGTPEYPDRSTTLLIQVEQLGTRGLTLQGPGILGTLGFSAAPLPEDFASQLAGNRAQFPCGVDIVLASATHVAALPRSVRIVSEG